LMSG
jgi:plastocyanin